MSVKGGPKFEDKKVTCPYNPAHQIQPHRMSNHLSKCQKQHSDANKKVCPYNHCHRFTSGETYDTHVATCPDRIDLQTTAIVHPYGSPGIENALVKASVGQRFARPAAMEDWEAEAVHVPYDPQKKCQENLIIRGIQGATKNERKKFYEEERFRHEMLRRKEGNASKGPIPGLPLETVATGEPPKKPNFGGDETRLRRPKVKEVDEKLTAVNKTIKDLSIRSDKAIAAAQSMLRGSDEPCGVTAIGRGRPLKPGTPSSIGNDLLRKTLERTMTTKK